MNSLSLKDKINQIRNINNETVSFEDLRIKYASERFLIRLSKSKYKENFVLKGGFLMGVIYQIHNRSTRDIDSVLKGITFEDESVEAIINEICEIDMDDHIFFTIKNIRKIQVERMNPGWSVKLRLNFRKERTYIDFSFDISMNDVITPQKKLSQIKLLFKEKNDAMDSVGLYVYPQESILAEKIETILSLHTYNSRMKDFYDIYLIINDINDYEAMYDAFVNTWNFRHPSQKINEELFEDWYFLIDELKNSEKILNYWDSYAHDKTYVRDLSIIEIIKSIEKLIHKFWEIYTKSLSDVI